MISRCTIFHGNLRHIFSPELTRLSIREPDSVGNFGYSAVSEVYALLFRIVIAPADFLSA